MYKLYVGYYIPIIIDVQYLLYVTYVPNVSTNRISFKMSLNVISNTLDNGTNNTGPIRGSLAMYQRV